MKMICPICGSEGYPSFTRFYCKNKECKNYFNEIIICKDDVKSKEEVKDNVSQSNDGWCNVWNIDDWFF